MAEIQWTEAQMFEWLGRFLWPLLRIGALFVSLPVFTSQGVPARARLALAVVISLVLAPVLPKPPAIELLSAFGFATAVQQIFIGLLAGYVIQLVYAAIVFGGQIVAYSMGLSFASLIDPQLGTQTPVVAQIYLMLTTFLFLGSNGHLILIELLADSFTALPVGPTGLDLPALKGLAAWSSLVFSGGVLMALPIMTVLLLVNLGLGIATRAAPQLNIFSIGFAVTLSLGMLILWLEVPEAVRFIGMLLQEGYSTARTLLLD